MPEIQIRPITQADIPHLKALDHHYSSDYVWQMDIANEDHEVEVRFREIRLPRSVRVEYPRPTPANESDWLEREFLLVALLDQQVVGYISINTTTAPSTAWVTDLVILRRLRRQGIGSALILAGQEWCRLHQLYRMVLEMQPKNYPAICLAQKLGFDFCGYNDRYFTNHDIALFFAKPMR